MELIKKQVQRAMTTGATPCDSGITGNCYQIIPDLTVDYNFKIMLKARDIDFGFFDVLSGQTGATGATISPATYLVTGTSSSRLSELKKFSTSGTLSDLYFTSTDPNLGDGVNTSLTMTATTWTYYIGGITYVDNVASNITTFSFMSDGYNSPNYVNLPIIKDEAKQNIIDVPEIDNNVFIVRQSLPVYQNIYRLQDIRTLSDLEKYAGGAKFNIVTNS